MWWDAFLIGVYKWENGMDGWLEEEELRCKQSSKVNNSEGWLREAISGIWTIYLWNSASPWEWETLLLYTIEVK